MASRLATCSCGVRRGSARRRRRRWAWPVRSLHCRALVSRSTRPLSTRCCRYSSKPWTTPKRRCCRQAPNRSSTWRAKSWPTARGSPSRCKAGAVSGEAQASAGLVPPAGRIPVVCSRRGRRPVFVPPEGKATGRVLPKGRRTVFVPEGNETGGVAPEGKEAGFSRPERRRPLARAEARQRGALAGVVEDHLDRLADAHAVGVAVHDVGHQPRALFELHVGQHVHARVAVLRQVRPATAIHGVAVDRAAAGSLEPVDTRGGAFGAERPREPDHRLAILAAREQQPTFGRGVPELFDLGIDEWRRRWQDLLANHAHASSVPRIKVALPMRVPSEPPVPCTSARSQLGTCTFGCASWRTCRTPSSTFIMPPMPGWLLHNPPPSVLTGSLPPGDSSSPSATNWPPLPFSQKPRSSIVSTTVMVNES